MVVAAGRNWGGPRGSGVRPPGRHLLSYLALLSAKQRGIHCSVGSNFVAPHALDLQCLCTYRAHSCGIGTFPRGVLPVLSQHTYSSCLVSV